MIASGKRFEGSKGIGVTTLAQLKYNILLVKKIKGGIWGDFGKWKGAWRGLRGWSIGFSNFPKML
jgi:hypothetical protein